MLKALWSRALVVALVTGGAFLLGRALSHSAAPRAGAAYSMYRVMGEKVGELEPAGCTQPCPSCPTKEDLRALATTKATDRPIPPDPTLETTATAEAASRPRTGDDVIVIAVPTTKLEPSQAPELDGADAALLRLPSCEAAGCTKGCPALMPYPADDERPSAAARSTSVVDFFFQWLCPEKASTERNAPAVQSNTATQSAPDVSRYEHLFPKPDRDLSPARSQTDTMEFRPTDARKGEFKPQPF